MARIGVLGGSFNPVHWGHLHIALLAREAAGLDACLFVPAAAPPHKGRGVLAESHHRLDMLRLALAREPGADICDLELRPGGPNYTIDTLDRLQGERRADELHFIMGFDSLAEFPSWRDPEAILARHRVVAVDRPGFDRRRIDPALAPRCLLVEGNPFALSGTLIRRRAARGLDIRHLVPAPVAEYIEVHRLYRETAGA